MFILCVVLCNNILQQNLRRMEYRKKHLRPKPGLTQEMKATLDNQALMEQVDFFQQLRKQGFASQNRLGIKSKKNCHLTSDGLVRFLTEHLRFNLSLQLKKSSKEPFTTIMKKLIESIETMDICLHVKDRVIEELAKTRVADKANPTEQEKEKLEKIVDQMNSKELQQFFKGRTEKLLQAVRTDRAAAGYDMDARSPARKQLPQIAINITMENITTQSSNMSFDRISTQQSATNRKLQSPPGFSSIENLFIHQRRNAIAREESNENTTVSQFEQEIVRQEVAKRPEDEFIFDDQTDQLLKKLAASQRDHSPESQIGTTTTTTLAQKEERLIDSASTAGSLAKSLEKENERNAHNQ